MLGRALFAFGMLALLVSPAAAEPVQHTFSGVIDRVTDGTDGTVDLTDIFSPGQPAIIIATVERSTSGSPMGDGGIFYLDAISEWSFAIGWYMRAPGPAINLSGIYVGNDLAEPGAQSPSAESRGALTDHYNLQIPNPYSPLIGSAMATYLLIDLVDADATAFSDTGLPRTLPDLAAFERAVWTLQFMENGVPGTVSGTLTSVSTPVGASSWGQLKAKYRD